MAINQFSCLSLNEKKSLLVCYLVPSLILITEAMGFDIDYTMAVIYSFFFFLLKLFVLMIFFFKGIVLSHHEVNICSQ